MNKNKIYKTTNNNDLVSLGNALGDMLISLELKVMKKSSNLYYRRNIRLLFNFYARAFDEVLDETETDMTGKLKELLLSLLENLELIDA